MTKHVKKTDIGMVSDIFRHKEPPNSATEWQCSGVLNDGLVTQPEQNGDRFARARRLRQATEG
ncbi:MAG: hypothetical protein OHK0022_60210 [Roseiflexaceae bacterium]